jgi:hypothetical protein
MLELDKQSIIRQEPIDRIAEFIKESPDTSGGVQLRRFLWSLYNMHHMVNLWNLVSRIAGEPADCVTQVLEAAFAGDLTEHKIKQALIASGEMERWEQTYVDDEVAEHIEGAQRALIAALRNLPPSQEHADLVRMTKTLEGLGSKLSAITKRRH